MMKRNRIVIPVWMLAVALMLASSAAVGQSSDADPLNLSTSTLDANAPIEVDAEQLDYDKINGRITASSNVVVTCGKDLLHADRVMVNINSGDAYALGNVVLKRGMQEIKAAKLQYNFRTRVSSIDAPIVDAAPFRVLADQVTRSADNVYVLRNAKVTTCVYKYPYSHYHVSAKKITVVPNESMTAYGATWYFGRVPCFYVPYWYQSLNEQSGWRFYPGYRSRWGAFLLSSYRQRLSPELRAEHHIDYRTERGFALGEDLRWNIKNGFGDVSLYFLNDDQPMASDRALTDQEIDSQRYRIRIRHSQSLGERTQMLLQANYLSDPDMLRDFFDREYRRSSQPETYLSIAHRQDAFTVSALANIRLNEFYSNVNRLPEVSLNVFRRQLGNSSIYYESQSSAASLERVWPDTSSEEAFSAFRLDTGHTIYQPRRLAGWLNLIPRAGYRATYYSESVASQVTGTGTNQTTTQVAADAVLRNVFEVGSEISYKAFMMLSDGRDGLPPWRHVFEPYADYSLRLEPSVLPDELHQFDGVDTLDELHQIRLGVRNKLQTKRNGVAVDSADVNLFTTLNLNTQGDEVLLDLINLDSEFHPASWMRLDVDGAYSLEASVLQQFNTRFSLNRQKLWEVAVEHRYRDQESNLLATEATFYPNQKWAFNLFGRYEFEGSHLEEQGGYVQRTLDCLCIRVGGSVLPGYTRSDGTVREDDYRVMLEISLTAFPEVGFGGSQR